MNRHLLKVRLQSTPILEEELEITRKEAMKTFDVDENAASYLRVYRRGRKSYAITPTTKR